MAGKTMNCDPNQLHLDSDRQEDIRAELALSKIAADNPKGNIDVDNAIGNGNVEDGVEERKHGVKRRKVELTSGNDRHTKSVFKAGKKVAKRPNTDFEVSQNVGKSLNLEEEKKPVEIELQGVRRNGAESTSSHSRKRTHVDVSSDSDSLATVGTTDSKIRYNDRWQEMFHKLKEYKDQFGHCLVPNRYSPDPPLGHWVSAQRRQYKIFQSGYETTHAMTEERVTKLESIGFEWEAWDPRHAPWEVRYKELCDYVKIHGDAKIPMRWKDNVQLSNWVSKQRHDYKLRLRGTSGRLTDERYRLLNDIGFVWEAGKNECEPPPNLPPHRPLKSRKKNGSNGDSAQISIVTHQIASDPSSCPPPPAPDVRNLLANNAMPNYAAMMQAASLNQSKLQFAGLYPAAPVGSSLRVPLGGLMALSIPEMNGISFIPVINPQGFSRVGPASHLATCYHRMHTPTHDATHGPPLPPAYAPPGAVVVHVSGPHPPLNMGALVYHGHGGAVQPPRSSSGTMDAVQPSNPQALRGADPPEG